MKFVVIHVERESLDTHTNYLISKFSDLILRTKKLSILFFPYTYENADETGI